MDQPPQTDGESGKTKHRPQQSCIKCRERKVKCDREKPCRSCIARGWQDECQYLRDDEDRQQISQADEIDALRKELNRLKRRYTDVQQTSSESPTAAPSYTANRDHDNAVTGEPLSWPRKAQKRTASDRYDGDTSAGPVFNAGYPGMVMHSNTMGLEYAPNFPGQPSNGVENTHYSPSNMMGFHEAFPGQAMGRGPEYLENASDWGVPGYYGDNNSLQMGTPLLYSQQGMPSNIQHAAAPAFAPSFVAESTFHQLQQHPQTNFWRGKQSLMQNIYRIIRDCDEAWVPSIISIVRSSQSPEEAIRSIHRLLRSSRSPTGSSSVPSETDASAARGLPNTSRSASNQSSPNGWTGN
ncbi:hypothetical protein BGW36DRAFT_428625 [Talaromyces proteolyticus]|uniref:Zn(2)-C6 fungal-type domain-containing protein n=1 Tax=Talaromyces proteolyticus TaxID=1131652 RepID=A0AAD4KV55_9EURO|nr:uncharacterized protein BGW36DRAFT_428625 [Talaromyces proteolyticus]KAH8696629.1 hypothetical protein BGW36DRAFT_428625 [Talaromyces proteolyticus]